MEMRVADRVTNMERELKEADGYRNIRLLHIDKRHLEVALHIRKERVSGIAGNDDRVTAILFETLG